MPELTDHTPEHQRKVQTYMDENMARLPARMAYMPSMFRSLDAYTHSREHRKFRKLCMNVNTPESQVLAAFRGELTKTMSSRYELWTWTTLAEWYWRRDDLDAHAEAVRRGVATSSQVNRPDDILGEWICDDSDEDALTRAGVP